MFSQKRQCNDQCEGVSTSKKWAVTKHTVQKWIADNDKSLQNMRWLCFEMADDCEHLTLLKCAVQWDYYHLQMSILCVSVLCCQFPKHYLVLASSQGHLRAFIDNIYLRIRDWKRQHFTMDCDIHSSPWLSTPLIGVDNRNTETVS